MYTTCQVSDPYMPKRPCSLRGYGSGFHALFLNEDQAPFACVQWQWSITEMLITFTAGGKTHRPSFIALLGDAIDMHIY